MNGKEDWEIAKKRWQAWWAHELYDRVLVQVTAPRADGDVDQQKESLLSDAKVNPETKWADFEHMIRRELEHMRTTYFGGEAIPLFNPGWSVGHCLFFGAEPHFRRDTVWVDPIPVGDDGYPQLHFSPDNHWWQWYRNGMKAAARASKGRYFILPEAGNDAADTLA